MSYFNRLGNVGNIYQTGAKRVLAVCSAGLLRSPTTANVLHQEYGYNTRAAGITPEYALIPVDDVLLRWADEVVFVENDVYQRALDDAGFANILNTKRVIVMNVPDMYEWNDPELRSIILKQYADAAVMEKAHVPD